MILSIRHTRAYFMPIILLAIYLVSVDARRYGGGGFRFGGGHRSSGGSRSSSGSKSGSGRGSGSHQVSVPKAPVHIPVYIPKPPAHVPPRHQPPIGTSFPQPHTPHNPGSTHAKESSNTLLHAEGGGRPRPGTLAHDSKQQSSPHQPSAPYEPLQKVNAGQVQSQGPTHGSNPGGVHPAWANPSTNTGHGAGSNPHAPNSGVPQTSQPHGSAYPNSPSGTNPLASAPYPPTHPAGPISHPMPMPHQNSYPHPNSPHNAPPPYTPPSSPYPSGHPQGMPLPPAPHIGFGSSGGVHQPIGAPHNYQPVGSSPMQPHGGYSQPTVIHNHYNGPPVGSPQNPAGHPVYGHQPVYGAAPMAQPFVPGQTVVVLPNQQSQSSGPGFGQILKEALVFSTVNAGVNRLINGAPHHHHDSPVAPAAASGGTPSTSTVTNTVIYNNQYGNPIPAASGQQGQTGQPAAVPPSPTGTAAGGSPASPAPTDPNSHPATGGTSNPGFGQPGAASSNPGVRYPTSIGTRTNSPSSNDSATNSTPAQVLPANSESANTTGNQSAPPPVQEFQYYVSNEELWNVTEKLFSKDEINASRYVTVILQERSTDPNATDASPAPLLHIHDEAFRLPTIQALRDMYDGYEFNSTMKEIMNSDRRRQENIFLDVFLNTDIMTTAMRWLSSKGYVEPDDFEWKDTIRHIWMTRVNGATSGFERVFMAETYPGPSVLGAQNWIYFEYMELLRRINYLSYVEKLNLGDKATLVKINFKIDDVTKPNTTMLIGTPPELEMALYTVCYYARPNDVCTVSLAGTKLNIYTHAFRYFGKDVLDLGLVFF